MLVGLAAEMGEMGVRGRALGDLSDREGRVTFCAAEMLKESFGFMARAVLYMTVEYGNGRIFGQQRYQMIDVAIEI